MGKYLVYVRAFSILLRMFVTEAFIKLLDLGYQCSLWGKSNSKGRWRLRFSLFTALISAAVALNILCMEKMGKESKHSPA